LELAEAGAELVIHGCFHQAEAREVAMAIQQRGAKSQLLMVDLSCPENQDRLVDEAWTAGPADIWINNAGADVLTGQVARESFETRLHRLWQVDVHATMRMSRDVGQRMSRRGRGVILNMGWDQAQTGMAGDSGQMFAAIKGAIMAFSLSLAKSLAPRVRVNCLAPGWIRTAWGEAAPPAWQQQAMGESLLGRWGTPTDVAQVARFLVSNEGSFINGQIIPINGGFAGAPQQPVSNCPNRPEDGSEGGTHR
jgi:3-oxoacyl-[acyl-carrier protein] reductase